MGIRELIYQANAESRRIARRACARKWVVRFCVVTTSASFGVAVGVLIAPKPGEKLRADLKKGFEKLVDTTETVDHEKTNDKKKD